MNTYQITSEKLQHFQLHLIEDEKASATVEKYMRDISSFARHIGTQAVTKELLVRYKEQLTQQYQPSSVNSMIAALNHFFRWCGWELHIKALKIQQRVFCDESRELSKEDYFKLLAEARTRGNNRLCLLLQTLAATGIRISELRFITVEAVKQGRADIHCKGKNRTILIPATLRKLLQAYAKRQKRTSGPLFVTRTGRLLDRSSIWRMLHTLCENAQVSVAKVFPHNFRHLFARVFYHTTKDIAKLADVLGHSNIQTTRIYIISSGQEHASLMESLGLVVDTT